jgi:hypothetical protein
VPAGPSPKAQLTIAACLLVAFGIVVGLMLAWADTWDQRVYVFGAVEAIVFTAVGWIFGREVHRQTAETAQQDAAEAKEDAKEKGKEVKELTKEAQKGHALKAAIDAAAGDTQPQSSGPRDVGALPAPGGATQHSSLAHLKAMAEKLYD